MHTFKEKSLWLNHPDIISCQKSNHLIFEIFSHHAHLEHLEKPTKIIRCQSEHQDVVYQICIKEKSWKLTRNPAGNFWVKNTLSLQNTSSKDFHSKQNSKMGRKLSVPAITYRGSQGQRRWILRANHRKRSDKRNLSDIKSCQQSCGPLLCNSFHPRMNMQILVLDQVQEPCYTNRYSEYSWREHLATLHRCTSFDARDMLL